MNRSIIQLSQDKLEAFHTGQMTDAYCYFGAHISAGQTSFTLWVPDVTKVSVACTDPETLVEEIFHMEQHPLDATIWQVRVPRKLLGYAYEYVLETPSGETLRKADPYAQASEKRPKTKSIVVEFSKHTWSKTVLQ
ncbi:MAG: 1,4-alpha-glucan branching protein GlgB, partial [Planococcus donghaensis]